MGEIADYYAEEFYADENTYKRRNVNMSNQSTRVVTGEVRFSFVNLLRPRANQFGGEEKYSVTILLPKSDVATKQAIDAAIQAAIEKGKAEKWNGVVPPNVSTPIHDGDGVKPSDGMPFGPECKGHWVFTATTGTDYPPKVVGPDLNPIMDATEIYSGMFGRIAINFSPYAFAGKKGVGCYISTNVQKTRDGEPLGASAPMAQEDFASLANTAPSSYGQQQQQGYQQPMHQQYQQQQPTQQQPQQQLDPITGQPLNGGVYGL